MAQERFPYQAVIFDMDGVIVDTERFYFDQLDEMYAAAGMPVSHEELSRAVGASYKDFQKNLVHWFAMGGVELSIEEAEARYDAWAKEHPADYASLLNPGVRETVAELKNRGVRVALASSSPMDNILHVLEVCGLSGAFELVTSGEQFHESKPNPEIYRARHHRGQGRRPHGGRQAGGALRVLPRCRGCDHRRDPRCLESAIARVCRGLRGGAACLSRVRVYPPKIVPKRASCGTSRARASRAVTA